MKKLTSFLQRVKSFADKEFWKYTGLFFAMLMCLYIYMLFKVGTDMPKFTYAEF